MSTTTGGEEKAGRNPKGGLPRLLTNAPLCQAKNRAGKSCRCPAVRGKRVCRAHGGLSPGAPKGERNGNWKHGRDSNEAKALRRAANALLRTVAGE